MHATPAAISGSIMMPVEVRTASGVTLRYG